MPETHVEILAGEHFMDGYYEPGNIPEAVILCHPHPLYGGNMDNYVVLVLQKVYRLSGCGTLRFNFRGVDHSSGTGNIGASETEDIRYAGEFLMHRKRGNLHLAGYSYGAWAALCALQRNFHSSSLLLISPPLDFMDFTNLQIPAIPCRVIVGEEDTFCSNSSLQHWIAHQENKRFVDVVTIKGCDHFYGGYENRLKEGVSEFLKAHLYPRYAEKNRV